MKYILLAIPLLAVVSLIACTMAPTAVPATGVVPLPTDTPAPTATSTSMPSPIATSAAMPVPTAVPTNATEEAEIRDLVESFGKRLQAVWLQSPNVVQEMKEQYSEFVSPALLETWMGDLSKAPGRVVSSPWPDRIEITTLAKEGLDKYVVTGFIVEVTSVEVASGGAAAKIPVRIVVQKVRDRWVIVEYSEQRS